MDKNRFSISLDIYTVPRSRKEKEKNNRRTLLVGGKVLPWITINTVSQCDGHDSDNEETLKNNCFFIKQNTKNTANPSNCLQKKYKNGNKTAKCNPHLQVNNHNNSVITKNSSDPYDADYQDEIIRICFNHIGVHYDCFEASGEPGIDLLRYAMLCYDMLCYVMLCHVMLCYVMLCYVMLCYANVCYIMSCYVKLCYVMLRYVMLCYVMLCYVMLCYVMLCYANVCYIMSCYVILCFVMLRYVMLCYVILRYVM